MVAFMGHGISVQPASGGEIRHSLSQPGLDKSCEPCKEHARPPLTGLERVNRVVDHVVTCTWSSPAAGGDGKAAHLRRFTFTVSSGDGRGTPTL